MNTNNTAVLLFSRSATSEAKAKPLARGSRASESVAAFAIDSITKLAQKTELPVFKITEMQQRGDHFGERFANAFEDVFQQGFDHVIAIGNDCLTITSHDILSAAAYLQSHPCILGPSKDGGAYLIGIQKNVFRKQAFQDIQWQSATTFGSLIDYLQQQQQATILLEEKSDIDTIWQWSSILPTIPKNIKTKLLQLFDLGKKTIIPHYNIATIALFWAYNKSLRAPPFI